MGTFGGSAGVADEEIDVESAEMAAPEEEAVSARSVVAERRAMLRRREERSQHAAFAKLATEDEEMEIAVPTSNASLVRYA